MLQVLRAVFQAGGGFGPYKVGGLRSLFFFFQAEDGIRDYKVTGVQTCALPIYHLGQEPRGDTDFDLSPWSRKARASMIVSRSSIWTVGGQTRPEGRGSTTASRDRKSVV